MTKLDPERLLRALVGGAWAPEGNGSPPGLLAIRKALRWRKR
ncbi:MAG: hypothetical protein ACRDQZ_06345 [Mycobacteriales bacterium]